MNTFNTILLNCVQHRVGATNFKVRGGEVRGIASSKDYSKSLKTLKSEIKKVLNLDYFLNFHLRNVIA